MTLENQFSIKPSPLKPGDIIGVVAPASHFDEEKLERGIDVIRSRGFGVYVPDGLFCKSGYLAGKDEKRARLFQDVFEKNDVRAVMAARGGFGSIRIAGMLDYDTISRDPKIFVGFSDITTILSVLNLKNRMVVFHGPTVSCLSSANRKTIDSLFSVISGTSEPIIFFEKAATIIPGIAMGAMAGGNLTTLCHLVGTQFHPSYKGHILFLEDRGEALYRIDRMLTQMKMAGCFNGLAGLLLGSFDACGPIDDIVSLFLEHFGDFGVPIMSCDEIGHGETNLTIPLGIKAAMDADNKKIEFLE